MASRRCSSSSKYSSVLMVIAVTCLIISAFGSLATSTVDEDADDDDGDDDDDDDNNDEELVQIASNSISSNHHQFCQRDLSTLQQLIVVFRHGDRTPEDIFPTDIHQEDVWPLGYGQLTERGILRSYELGQWSRSCYSNYLSNILSPRRVYARSTDYDRTLMSAKAHLAGAYPQLLGSDFPIYTEPVKSDFVMRGHKNCPRFHELGEEIDSSERALKIIESDKEFLKMVAEMSGLNSSNILRPTLIVADSVLVELENNLPIVDWLNDDSLIDKLVYYSHLAFDLYYNNAEMAKLIGGPLLLEIIERLKDRSRHGAAASNFEHVLYSGHSTVMGGLLGSLGSMNNLEPPYAAAVLFELHKIEENFVVKVFYRNSTEEDPYPLSISGCNDFENHGCSLAQFQQALAHRVSRTHEADCRLKNVNFQMPTLAETAIIVGSAASDPRTGDATAQRNKSKSAGDSTGFMADQQPRVDYVPPIAVTLSSDEPVMAK